MKRKNKYVQRLVIKKNKTYWPMMFCLKENIPIGVSQVKWKKDEKVDAAHWQEGKCQFKEGHKVELSQYKQGERVVCPVCGGDIDFRLWMSDSVPTLK